LKGKHVLITGHTGFKGSWLVAMLHSQGAKVSGISLDPVEGGIFQTAKLQELLVHDLRKDIRDATALTESIQMVEPDIVIHLAAQPLVLASYENPQETYETNVMGTLNVLQAVEATPSVQATLIITTDKVYGQESADQHAFVESDYLGAADPYSTSKAMADLLTQSWILSHPESKIGIARAGNVIGGGDVAENRLLPDLVMAFGEGAPGVVRNPKSVRPWQHVLDCLAGYLCLTEGLLSGSAKSGAYNFGPEPEAPLRVEDVVKIAAAVWGEDARWIVEQRDQPHESQYLVLNSNKSQSILGWKEKLTAQEAIEWSVEWSRSHFSGQSPRSLTFEQLSAFASK
jgi:CDP-glucose 4,6-dehydratase